MLKQDGLAYAFSKSRRDRLVVLCIGTFLGARKSVDCSRYESYDHNNAAEEASCTLEEEEEEEEEDDRQNRKNNV